MNKIMLSDVLKKHLKVLSYLIVSGLLAYALVLIIDKPELSLILAPAINYALYALEKEIKNEGVVRALND